MRVAEEHEGCIGARIEYMRGAAVRVDKCGVPRGLDRNERGPDERSVRRSASGRNEHEDGSEERDEREARAERAQLHAGTVRVARDARSDKTAKAAAMHRKPEIWNAGEYVPKSVRIVPAPNAIAPAPNWWAAAIQP